MKKKMNIPLLCVFFIILFLPSLECKAQYDFFSKNLKWSKYEAKIPQDEKIKTIETIDDDLLIFLKSNNILEDKAKNFRFFDYNFNGKYEIFYSGDAGTDSERTLIFQLNENGEYEKVFDEFGIIIDFKQLYPLLPNSIVLYDETCCGGILKGYRVFFPVLFNEKIDFVESISYWSVKETKLPSTFFSKPVPFKVTNNSYNLRLSPKIEDDKYYPFLNITGNVIGKYNAGARGFAISEETDQTGRIWWFVVIINNEKTHQSIITQPGSRNLEDTSLFYSFGWMSSRFLKKTNDF